MKRIMLDLETFDTKPTAVVISVGAVEFDLERGLGQEFYKVIDLKEPNGQVRRGRTIDPATIKWWLGQSEDARHPFISKTHPVWSMSQVLWEFRQFVQNVDSNFEVEMWGNGSDFDNVILGSLYETYGIDRPWSYGNNRCFRTLKNLGIKVAEPEMAGTAHNALDDAKHQARRAVLLLRAL